MGNCIVLQEKVVKVMKIDGKILKYKAPIKVHQILSQFSCHVISTSFQVTNNQHLQPHDDLLGGQIYYLLPSLPMQPPPKSTLKKVKFANDQVNEKVMFANDQVNEEVKCTSNDQMIKKLMFANDQVNDEKVMFVNDQVNEKFKFANAQVIKKSKFANDQVINEKAMFANDQVNHEKVMFASDQVNHEKVRFPSDQVEILEASDQKKEVIRVKIVITKKELQELLSNEGGLIKVDDIKSTTTIVDETTIHGKGWKPILDIIPELD